jgi:VWFA-related protein
LVFVIVLLAPAIVRGQADTPALADEARVVVRSTNERASPDITLDFELRRPDGTPILDARKEDFTVTEYDRPVEVRGFHAPASLEIMPTTIVLVLDRSRSMLQEDRLGAMKEAVREFLEVMPSGSRVAVVVFSDDVRVRVPLTDDTGEVREAVEAIRAQGSTRFYDAVDRALDLIAEEGGRRAVLALTDGMDNSSEEATPPSLVRKARNVGVPVHTLGVGSEDEIATDVLRELASETRGEWFHAPRPEQLRSIFEELARGLGESYTLTYRTDRKLPDGTLRPVRIAYRHSRQVAEASVFIRGMVVPAGGWSRLCLGLVAVLAALAVAPGLLKKRTRPAPGVTP